MSKLTLHLVGPAPGWVQEFLDVSGAKVIKGLNWYPDYQGVSTIGRVYMAQTTEPEPIATLIRAGLAGADQLFDYVWPEVQKNPHVKLWEVYNEASIWEKDVLHSFPVFNRRLIERFHERNLGLCVGAINTGWPTPKQFPAIAIASIGADALSFHEYSPETYMVGHPDICRYRSFHDWCARMGYEHPPIYITECGIDSMGGPDHGHYGWRSMLMGNEDAYVEQLALYENELQKDDYVVAATVFTTGGDWPEFEFGESCAMKLARRIGGKV